MFSKFDFSSSVTEDNPYNKSRDLKFLFRNAIKEKERVSWAVLINRMYIILYNINISKISQYSPFLQFAYIFHFLGYLYVCAACDTPQSIVLNFFSIFRGKEILIRFFIIENVKSQLVFYFISDGAFGQEGQGRCCSENGRAQVVVSGHEESRGYKGQAS